MVGQIRLKQYLKQMVDNNMFPRFSIFVGERGSEKVELAKYVQGCLGAMWYEVPNVKIDTIRDLIERSYIMTVKTVFVIPNADEMSVPAKNALLKITEEPPNNAYFIMTLDDIASTLDTIRSRASIFHMERYTKEQIYNYAKEVLNEDEAELVVDICTTPGEVDLFTEMSAGDLFNFVNVVIDHIADVTVANALKIAERINLKSEPDNAKYDLKMFWKAFMIRCGESVFDGDNYYEWARTTSRALSKLIHVKGVNKQMLFDSWLFDIREWR